VSQGVIARRYAKALIKLAEKGQELEKTGECFSEIALAYQDSAELREVLSDPKVSTELKQSVLKAVLKKLKAPALVDTFSRYLLSKRRIALLPSIESAFNLLLQDKLGRIEARVTVAHELPNATVAKLEKSISDILAKTSQSALPSTLPS
jgi:F-type H+-transporting ATPase subunit delta